VSKAVLSLSGCSYRYPSVDRWAFANVDFSIAPGEMILVRGRNGSGKSTLLKVVAGLLAPSKGVVTRDQATRPVYMDQSADDMLAFDLTVREHLAAFQHDTPSGSGSVSDLLQRFGVDLEFHLDEFVGNLSGGQRQIVALLATIGSGANLFCLDEFLSALDAKSTRVASGIVGKLVKSDAISVVAVSHTPVDIVVDRELVLDKD
jgi:ABC-type multidrug transport system ATPase subunit